VDVTSLLDKERHGSLSRKMVGLFRCSLPLFSIN
jgi:hypothetical protein